MGTNTTEIRTVLQGADPTGTGSYDLVLDGFDYILLTQPGEDGQPELKLQFAKPAGPETKFRFRESWGGALHLQSASNGKYVCLDDTTFVLGELAQAVAFEPQFGNAADKQLRVRGVPQNRYLARSPTPDPSNPNLFSVVVANTSTGRDWELKENDAPTNVLTRWRQTYNATNQFSPIALLTHMLEIINHQDPKHGAAYWLGLSQVTASGLTVGQSISGKIEVWLGADFDTSKTAQATAVMANAGARFYDPGNPASNELDPEVPPDWTGIDEELGEQPYPG